MKVLNKVAFFILSSIAMFVSTTCTIMDKYEAASIYFLTGILAYYLGTKE